MYVYLCRGILGATPIVSSDGLIGLGLGWFISFFFFFRIKKISVHFFYHKTVVSF